MRERARGIRGTVISATEIRAIIFEALNRRFFYGWTIVAVGCLGIMTSGPGQSHTFSVFVGPISRDLGLSSSAVPAAYGGATLAAAFLLPQAGRFVDRFGPRRMLLVVVAALGLACLLFGAVANLLWLSVGFAALRFLGQGSLMLTCANLVSQWFNRDRGLAMSLMAVGFGVSMAVHPPLAQQLVETVGWRAAWVGLGVITWLTMLPPVFLLVYSTPEERGLQPDGAGDDAEERTSTGPREISGLTLRQALGHSSFYLLAMAWFSMSMLVTTLHFYQVTILKAQGIAATTAASLFVVSAVAMVLCMPLVGRAFDRFRTRSVIVAGLVVTATSLLAASQASSLPTAVLYALVFGTNNALTMTVFGYVWPRYFGRRHLGSIQGTGQLIGVVGASVGPLPVGLAFDLGGDPLVTLQILALIPLTVAALVAAFLRTHPSVTGTEHLE